MLTINFYPESNKPEYIKAAKEYALIWKSEGKQIIESIEKISRFTFKTKYLNAVTFGGHSFSIPLRLASDQSIEQKKRIIIHELCHRLIIDNNVKKFRGKLYTENWNYQVHKIVDLILWDIWVDLFGKTYADKNVEAERKLSKGYKKAWNFVLSKYVTKTSRLAMFKSYFNSEQ